VYAFEHVLQSYLKA